ncbi:DUF3560 domain-containing protein [Mycolicibacterium fortuitum]|uniref:DUF3560 domain-containing protein n=1 Tax=Mycolicibacterium fortuitum TaxID=1766 RepID=UPI003AAAEFD7
MMMNNEHNTTAQTDINATVDAAAIAPSGSVLPAQEQAPTIEIVHNAEDGTLVYGTSRGDGTNTILKSCGFRWFRTLGLWGIPSSRDKQPNMFKISRAAKALRQAGHQVSERIDTAHRPIELAEADRAQRQEDRAQALSDKADRKAQAADAAWEAEERAVAALPPGGEPIKIGHHSERRHRRAIERAHEATRRAIDATDTAKNAAHRADAAAHTTTHRYSPVTVKNRIDRLEADQRRDQRILDGHRRVVARTANTEYVDEFPPATGEYRERVAARLAQTVDQIAYWKGVYAELQAEGLANTYSRETVSKGDQVKYRGRWYTVVRANPKTVSVHLFEGASFTNTIGYHELSGHRPAGESPQPLEAP